MRYILCCFLLSGLLTYGQRDTLRLKNKDQIIGEIKSIVTGTLTMETDYSDDDFTIEYDEVSEMIIERRCIVDLVGGGGNRFGYVRSGEPGKVTIYSDDGRVETFNISAILSLQEVEDKFFSRFSGAIDLGFNITKASNNKQLNISGRLSFTGEKWIFNSNINSLSSTQDNAEDVKRLDANIETLRLLRGNWFLTTELIYLQNTEQALDARWSPNIAIGNMLVSNPKMYFGISAGLNMNFESFVDETLDKSSTEIMFQADLNMFNFKDLKLTTNLKLFPSITEQRRFRTDFVFNISYDLPLDFYVKLGLTVNYDNQPAIAGTEIDYIFKSGLGWSFN